MGNAQDNNYGVIGGGFLGEIRGFKYPFKGGREEVELVLSAMFEVNSNKRRAWDGGVMATKTYRLKIAREGYEFEAEGDKAFVLDMLKRFAPQPYVGAAPPEKIPPDKGHPRKATTQVPASARSKAISIREFIQQLALI